MAKDPVCGMQVDEKLEPLISQYKGATYYFCSTGCKSKFDLNPESYAQDRSKRSSDKGAQQEKKVVTCCGDVMEPIEATSCCTPQDATAHAARAMSNSGCGCAPVVEDRENLKLVGVVTERDVCCHVAATQGRTTEVTVKEIMQPSSSCCGADDAVDDARRKLYEHRARSLPVVDKSGNCCGTVSAHHVEKS